MAHMNCPGVKGVKQLNLLL